MSDVADVLERAAKLIEPEGAWIKGWFAKDDRGRDLEPGDPHAVCWCARGAILQAEPQAEQLGVYEPLCTVLGVIDLYRIEEWNDVPGRTQAEVVAKLREAAKLARENADA